MNYYLYKYQGRNFPNNKVYYSGNIKASVYDYTNTYLENATQFPADELKLNSTKINKNRWSIGQFSS